MEKYAVIMAGGGGTRFWPLSRESKPKQFLNLTGQDAMINETMLRVSSIFDDESIFIVTNSEQYDILKEVALDSLMSRNIICESMRRDTAVCIAYAAFKIFKRCGDGVMCVLPSDHYIKDEKNYNCILNKAIKYAQEHDKLVTIGIKPTFPSTGYGYIKYNKSENSNIFKVEQFVEKPNYNLAKQYLDNGEYLWNSGMFVWKISTILDNFERYLPKIYYAFKNIEKYLDTELESAKIEELYNNISGISIDYGIMERSDDVVVIEGDFGWSDVGSFDSLSEIIKPDKNLNIVKGNHFGFDTTECVVLGDKRLISTIGVNNLIIVDTDDVVLVCNKQSSQDIKKMVTELKNRKMEKFL